MTINLGFLQSLSHSLGWAEYYAWHMAGFVIVYFGLASLCHLLINRFLIRRGMVAYIDARPLKPGQIRHEIRHSLSSMLFLSFFAVLALKLEQQGLITIHWKDFTPLQTLGNVLFFALWNELYFFSCHWLLHRPFFFRHVHAVHHYSMTTSPFSSLSFHWFEALLYSGTMICIMLMHSFDILSIMLWPVISLVANTFGHANVTWPSHTQGAAFIENNWRHGTHHRRVNCNFSFWTPWLDQWLAMARKSRQQATEN